MLSIATTGGFVIVQVCDHSQHAWVAWPDHTQRRLTFAMLLAFAMPIPIMAPALQLSMTLTRQYKRHDDDPDDSDLLGTASR